MRSSQAAMSFASVPDRPIAPTISVGLNGVGRRRSVVSPQKLPRLVWVQGDPWADRLNQRRPSARHPDPVAPPDGPGGRGNALPPSGGAATSFIALTRFECRSSRSASLQQSHAATIRTSGYREQFGHTRRLLSGCGRLIRPRPRKLLANGPDDLTSDLGAFEDRMFSPKLAAENTARLTHRADDAIEGGVRSLDDALQAGTGGAVALKVLRLGAHFLFDGQIECVSKKGYVAGQVGITPCVQGVRIRIKLEVIVDAICSLLVRAERASILILLHQRTGEKFQDAVIAQGAQLRSVQDRRDRHDVRGR